MSNFKTQAVAVPIAEPTTAPTAISGELTAIPSDEAGAREGVLLKEDLPDTPEHHQHRGQNTTP